MDRSQIQEWAKSFAADLAIEGEYVPFERVVADHLTTLNALNREMRLTWVSIAAFLQRAGAVREDGQVYSSDQLRATVSRVRRELKAREAARPVPTAQAAAATQRSARPKETPSRVRPETSRTLEPVAQERSPSHAPGDDKDVSSEEMRRALSAITRR